SLGGDRSQNNVSFSGFPSNDKTVVSPAFFIPEGVHVSHPQIICFTRPKSRIGNHKHVVAQQVPACSNSFVPRRLDAPTQHPPKHPKLRQLECRSHPFFLRSESNRR